MIRTRTCAYQEVRNKRKFGMLCFFASVLRFVLVPYYRGFRIYFELYGKEMKGNLVRKFRQDPAITAVIIATAATLTSIKIYFKGA